MASKNTFRTVLSVIKSAPHALTTGEIKNAMGVRSLGRQDDINGAVKQLFAAGYLKRTTQKSDRGYNRYFTNPEFAKTSAIRGFVAGTINSLPGIVFTDTAATTPRQTPAPATTAINGDRYNGALVKALRTILKDLRSAPSSVHIDNFSGGLLFVEFDKAFNVLLEGSFIKLHADRTDHYFTRKPMRAKIDAFIASGNISDLTGTTSSQIVQASTPVQEPTSRSTPSQKPWEIGMYSAPVGPSDSFEDQYRAALVKIVDSPNAVSWGMVPYGTNAKAMCNNLTKAGLTKEHRDKPGHYFTRKPNRELIGKFLMRLITLEELFTQAKQPGQMTSQQPRGYAEFESDDYRAILDAMRNFEHSVSRDDIELATFGDVDTEDPGMAKMIGFLKDAGLIKEDSQKANYWFTRKPNRQLIDAFIDGDKTIAQLFSEAKRPSRG